MKITRHCRTLALVFALAVSLVAVPTASAHKLSLDTARAKAQKKAAQIKRETNAKKSVVKKCRRKSKHKVVCNVRSTYRTGASPCITKVPVQYSSHADQTASAAIGETKCF